MIVGSHIDLDKVKASVELYWWPRMLSDELSVELTQNDRPLPPPEPMDSAGLIPYIKCYEWVVRGAVPEEERDFYTPRAISNRKPGKMGLVELKRDPDEDGEDEDERENELESTIALVRSGPKMVVRYLDPRGYSGGNFAATFVSDPEAERDLHLSEPPSHDSWNHNSLRFDDAYSDPVEREAARRVVSETIKRIRKRARQFQRKLEPPAPQPIVVSGTKTLERMLARLMAGRGSGTITPPPRPYDPFEVRIEEGRSNSRSGSKVTARAFIKLKADAPVDDIEVVATIVPSIVQDDNRARDPHGQLELAWVKVNGRRTRTEDGGKVRARISKAESTAIEAESKRFDRDLYASLELLLDASRNTNQTLGAGETEEDAER